MELSALFFSAFLAATLLPGGSEVTLLYLDHTSQHGFWNLLVAATAGNTLGGMLSYGIGRVIPASKTKSKNFQQAVNRVQKYGSPILLLSWVPLIGDVLCVAAGWIRMHWLIAAVFIGIGKTLRYALLLLVL